MLKEPRSFRTHLDTITSQIDRVGHRDHFVQFYRDEQMLAASVARFFAVGFAQGNVAILIAAPERRHAIESALRSQGVDIDALRESGDYSPFDAREMLSHFMVDGAPNGRRFRALLGSWMDAAVGSGTGVRAFGEMVALLCADGNDSAAIELEHLWNDLGEIHEFTLFCAYPSEQFAKPGRATCLSHVCRAHSRVISEDSPAAVSSEAGE